MDALATAAAAAAAAVNRLATEHQAAQSLVTAKQQATTQAAAAVASAERSLALAQADQQAFDNYGQKLAAAIEAAQAELAAFTAIYGGQPQPVSSSK